MKPRYTDKVVVITGASDGIGAELARQLASQRPKLVLAARNADALAKVAKQCSVQGALVLCVPTDVSVEADCAALARQAVERFGGIDVLVANAGVSGHAMFSEVSDFGWYEEMMRVNHFGTLWCVRHALPHLLARRGQIVGVSSLAGLFGVPGRTAYCASKFAMTGFLQALRIELAPQGIGVTIAYPGVVATQIRHRGFGPDGRPAGASGLDEGKAMSVETCANLILRAMSRRSRNCVMTAEGKLGLWLKQLLPDLVDALARRKLARTRRRG
ncbi:SDR family oxidoreductase [Niveibacterium sp. 24ML]|uniref:SDR family oxidoreductase n=1 Tax=Niveibacterium sp. 24ML TaxID=2985512 RepID=UPI0022700D28|nr:SDR family oxidoreductase [Niveibacterium sp. 24ML]MCX9155871.1 SDR family oxidoreductase [Niveibacterium sp. 24ML]